MNNSLKKEIILHIFKSIGLFNSDIIGFMEKLNNDKFLLNKKLAFETEDKKQVDNNIWAASAKIENSDIKIIIADITEDIREFTLILQMDNFVPCAMRISEEQDDFGSIFLNVEDNKWVSASTLLQAKSLVGFESLSGIYLQWSKLEKYMDMYKLLVGFLNFYELDENNER